MPPTTPPELNAREIEQLFTDIKEIKMTLKEITGIHAKEIAELQKEIGDLRVELATMKVKIGIVASLASLLGGGIITFVVGMLKDSPK